MARNQICTKTKKPAVKRKQTENLKLCSLANSTYLGKSGNLWESSVRNVLAGEGVEKLDHSYITGENVQWYSPSRKLFANFS